MAPISLQSVKIRAKRCQLEARLHRKLIWDFEIVTIQTLSYDEISSRDNYDRNTQNRICSYAFQPEILYKHTEPVIRHEEAIGDDPFNIISD